MMKVCYSEMDTPAGLSCRLEAAGHAGYAPAGQDIVCAGASTVMQGLVYLLAGEENAHSEAFDEPDGPRLAVSVDAPCEEWVRGAFELAKACFALLAERYPENVRFADVSRRGKESMMDLQLFADAGTLVNAGGNYVNAYTGEKTAFPEGGGMTASMKTFYDTELLENARPELIPQAGAAGRTRQDRGVAQVEYARGCGRADRGRDPDGAEVRPERGDAGRHAVRHVCVGV